MTADDFTKSLNMTKFGKFHDLIDIEDCKWTQSSKPANWQASKSTSKKTTNKNTL